MKLYHILLLTLCMSTLVFAQDKIEKTENQLAQTLCQLKYLLNRYTLIKDSTQTPTVKNNSLHRLGIHIIKKCYEAESLADALVKG